MASCAGTVGETEVQGHTLRYLLELAVVGSYCSEFTQCVS